jgi:hypothetical protein
MKEKQALKALLTYEIQVLDRSIENIKYSISKVEKINLEHNLSEDQFELFDSFSSRFMRLYEVLFNQVIRTTLSLLNELKLTNLDNMNKAEQLDMITTVADINEVRKLRNQVAHEYLDNEWIPIYIKLLECSKTLLRSCQMTKTVIAERFPDLQPEKREDR